MDRTDAAEAELSASRSLLEEARLAMDSVLAIAAIHLLRPVLAKIEASQTPEVKP